MLKKLMLSAALALTAMTGANAATVTFAAVGSTGVPAGYGVDIGSASWSPSPAIVDGTLSGNYRSPYDQSGAPGTAGYSDYFTVGSPTLQGSPATLLINVARNTFKMLWGSVDTYNAVTFCGGLDCVTVTGSQIAAAAPANFGTGNAIVNFSADFAFDTIAFVSDFGLGRDRPAFEFAVAAVPLPAGGLLLLGALGGIAALRRRKTA